MPGNYKTLGKKENKMQAIEATLADNQSISRARVLSMQHLLDGPLHLQMQMLISDPDLSAITVID